MKLNMKLYDIRYSIFYILIRSQTFFEWYTRNTLTMKHYLPLRPTFLFLLTRMADQLSTMSPQKLLKNNDMWHPPALTSLTIGKNQRTTTNGLSLNLCWIMLNPCPAPAKLTRLLEDLGRRAVRHGVLAITWRPLSQQYFKGWSGRTDLGVAGNLGRSYQLPRWQAQRCNSLKNCYWFISIPIIPLQLLRISGYTLHFSDKPDHFGWNTVFLNMFFL